jgi:putative transferase (TIGR04331 family)
MEYFRTTNYSDYLDKSLANVSEKRIFREETESLKIPKNSYSKTQIYQPGFSKNFSLKLSLSSFLKIERIKDKRAQVFFDVDLSLRNKVHARLSQELISHKFSTWFSDRAIEFFPKSLLEGLPFLLDNAEKYPKKDTLFSSDSWHILDGWRIYAASQRDRGAKLLGSPHAINHGCSTHFWLRDFELSNLDQYYTWGWNKESKISVTPFFTPKFSGKKRPTTINAT